MVDLINRGDDSPESMIDSLGIRKTEKRKRVQEVQVPLPAHKRAHIYQPGNRVNVLDYERYFKETVPWVFGLPMSFFENSSSKVRPSPQDVCGKRSFPWANLNKVLFSFLCIRSCNDPHHTL